MTEALLQSLGRRLVKDHELYEKYSAGMKKLIEARYVEKVITDGMPGWAWYLNGN